MMMFKIRHNYCGQETYIEGDDMWSAMRKAGKDLRYWTVVAVEKI